MYIYIYICTYTYMFWTQIGFGILFEIFIICSYYMLPVSSRTCLVKSILIHISSRGIWKNAEKHSIMRLRTQEEWQLIYHL